MGTLIALAYVQRFPDHVGAVVLAGVVTPKPACCAEGTRIEAANAQRLDAANAQRLDAFMKRPALLDAWRDAGLPNPCVNPKDRTLNWRIGFAGANIFHVDRWREMRGGMIHYSGRAAEATSSTIPMPYDFVDAIDRHDRQLSVIVGDNDYVGMGPELAHHHFGSRSDIQLFLIPNAAHNVWIDAPEHFREAVSAGLGASTE
jgi:pimeloyl-ACP methyl ester carboxylesterase